jgi:tRNA modification GTPase
MDTFVSLLTPRGEGGIGVINVIGRDAKILVNNVFRCKNGAKIEIPFKLYYGEIIKDGEVLDEVVVRFIPAGESFSGEDTIEICCHGGVMAPRIILFAMKNLGAKEIGWEKIIDIALENGNLDDVQAEAYKLLPYARTGLSAKVLNDQALGALSKAIKEIRSTDDVKNLLETSNLGIALVNPYRIVIIGAPNVGKSTLFNTLVGKERVLVHPTPGTTRDWVDEIMIIDDIPFILIDTAGLWNSLDPLDLASMEKTKEQIKVADLVIMLYDATTDKQDEFIEELHNHNVIICINKIDITSIQSFKGDYLYISALKGFGIDNLKKEILKRLNLKAVYNTGAPVVFTRQQKEGLEKLF